MPLAQRHRRSPRTPTLGIEAEHLTVAATKRSPSCAIEASRLQDAPPLVERARMVKDAARDLDQIRTAVELGASSFDRRLTDNSSGSEGSRGCRRDGIRSPQSRCRRHVVRDHHCFGSAVGAATWTSLRAAASRPGDSWSATSVLYSTVIVRTVPALCTWVLYGRRCRRKSYDAVREAQQAAIEAVRPGATVGEVDAAARKIAQGMV